MVLLTDKSISQEKTALMILGMHRSGTSALARICNLLGYDLGSTIALPKSDNALGFWENDEVCQLTEELRDVCHAEFQDSLNWCVKDPRSSHLLPIWIDLLSSMNVRPLVVIAFRNPLAVASSLAKRNNLSLNHACMAWLRPGSPQAARRRRAHVGS